MLSPELEMSVAKFVAVVAVAFVTALAVGFILLGVYLGSKEEKTMPKEMDLKAIIDEANLALLERMGIISQSEYLKLRQETAPEHVSDEKGLGREHGKIKKEEPLNPLAAYVVAMADRIKKTEDYGTEPQLVEMVTQAMRSPDVLAFLKARDKAHARATAIGEERWCGRCEREFAKHHDLKQHNLGKHDAQSPLLTRLLMDMTRELPLSHSKNTLSSYLRILQEPEYAEEPTSRALRNSIERVLKALQQQEETDRKSRESWLFS